MVNKVAKLKFAKQPVEAFLRLDLGTGAGKSRPEGFVGVDRRAGKGVDVVTDLRKTWPWEDDTVEEANAHNILHLLAAQDRIHFMNELHRVLKPQGKASIILPHWLASRAYQDMTVQWPPVTEAWFVTLNKVSRENMNEIDTTGLTCDFDFTLGYGLHPMIMSRNQEYQQHAVSFWKEAAQDVVCTLIKR